MIATIPAVIQTIAAVIQTIAVVIQTTPAAALSGLLSFYSVAVTRVALAIPAATTITTAVTVFGLSFYFSAAAATETLSVNLRTRFIEPTYSEPAAVFPPQNIFVLIL